MSKENIHYLGHLVKYLICNSEIESLNEGTIMLGSSKKFGSLGTRISHIFRSYGNYFWSPVTPD